MAELVITAAATVAANWLLQSLRPKPSTDVNYRLPASSYGQNIPIIINHWRVSANWIEPLEEDHAFESNSAGGKGFGGGGNNQDVITGNFLGLLAGGGEFGNNLSKLILSGDKVVDFESDDDETISASYKYVGGENLRYISNTGTLAQDLGVTSQSTNTDIEFFNGLSTQPTWTYLESIYGINNAIRYKDLTMIAFEDFEVTEFGNTFPNCSVILRSVRFYDLADTVTYICSLAGYDTNTIDATELVGIQVRGMPIPRNGEEHLAPLETLMAAYFFFASENELGGLTFKLLRRPSTTLTLTYEDLGCYEIDDTPPETLQVEFEDVTEFPTQINVSFYDPFLEYEQNSIPSDPIPGVENNNIETVDLNLVLTEEEAKTIANRYLFQIRNNFKTYRFTLSIKFIDQLEPGDVVAIPNGELLQISELEIGANYLLEVSSNFYDSNGLDSTAIVATPTSRANTAPIVDPSFNLANLDEFYLLDIPIFDSSHIEQGVYFVSQLDAMIYTSFNDLDFFFNSTYTGSAVIGDTTNTLDAIPNTNLQNSDIPITDNTSSLDVVMGSGRLESITSSSFDSGNNLFFVGRRIGNEWEGEYIQARIATLTGTNTYTLTEMRRGLFGTQYFTDQHTANEKIFLLRGQNANFVRIDSSTATIGSNLYSRILVDNTQTIDTVTSKSINYQAKSLYPRPVLNVSLVQTPVDDLVISFIEDPRFNFVLGEETDSYEIDIYNGTTLVRTVTTTNNVYCYLPADQVTDFGAIQTQLTGQIFKISSLTGRGFVSDFNLTASTTQPAPVISAINPDVLGRYGTIEFNGLYLSQITYVAINDFLLNQFSVNSDLRISGQANRIEHLGSHTTIKYATTLTALPNTTEDINTLTDVNFIEVDLPTAANILLTTLSNSRALDINHTLESNDVHKLLLVDTTAGNIDITLDSSVISNIVGQFEVTIINVGTNQVNFLVNTDTLNSGGNSLVGINSVVKLLKVGDQWYVTQGVLV